MLAVSIAKLSFWAAELSYLGQDKLLWTYDTIAGQQGSDIKKIGANKIQAKLLIFKSVEQNSMAGRDIQ